jgi:hypothetical protein
VKHSPLSDRSCPGHPVAGGSVLEAGPRRLGRWAHHCQGSQQVPGVVIQGIHHPDLGAIMKVDLGGVDLPQVVGNLPLEALCGLRSLLRLVGHQLVAPEGLVDGRDRRRVHPRAVELRSDPPGSPPGMILSHAADLHLQVEVNLGRRPCGPTGSWLQARGPLRFVAAPVLVERVPGDAPPATYLGHRTARSLRLQQDFQPELRHRHHPQAHAHLPVVRGRRDQCGWCQRCVRNTCQRCVRNDLSGMYPDITRWMRTKTFAQLLPK